MKPEDAEKLARRFIALPLDKRRLFLQALAREGVEFSLLPIPAQVEGIACAQPSYAQQRMGLLWLLDPEGAAYNLPGAVRLQGVLDLDALSAAFEALVARHEPLRTLFRLEEGIWYPRVQAPGPLALERHDLAGCAKREQRLQDIAQQQAGLPFDLQEGPLLRVCLVRLAEDEHVLLLTLHHIVADGWSMNVLIDEFSRLYAQCVAGQAPQLPPLPIQYADYALWQRSWLEAGELQRQLDYWTAQLGDEQPVLELPTDFPRPAAPSYRGVRLEFAIDPALAMGLRTLAQQQGVTLFMVLLASFQALLHRYTGQQDIRVGMPVAGRGKAETEGLIGLFVNTQVLRAQPRGISRSARCWPRSVRQCWAPRRTRICRSSAWSTPLSLRAMPPIRLCSRCSTTISRWSPTSSSCTSPTGSRPRAWSWVGAPPSSTWPWTRWKSLAPCTQP